MKKFNKQLAKASTRLLLENQNQMDKNESLSKKLKQVGEQLRNAHAIMENHRERASEIKEELLQLKRSVSHFCERTRRQCLCVDHKKCKLEVYKKIMKKEEMVDSSSSDSE